MSSPAAIGRNAHAGSVLGTHASTPVAAQQIWHEHVHKELKFLTIREEYTSNPKTIACLPDKPTDPKRTWQLNGGVAGDAANSMPEQTRKAYAEVSQRLSELDRSPRSKYNWAQTSNMEYGWDLDWAAKHRAEVRQHTTASSDVAKFADAYVNNHGYHPFSNKQFKYHAKPTNQK